MFLKLLSPSTSFRLVFLLYMGTFRLAAGQTSEFFPSQHCYLDLLSTNSDISDLGVYGTPLAPPFIVFSQTECLELCQREPSCCRAKYMYGNCMGRRCELYGKDSVRVGEQVRGYHSIECSALDDRTCDDVIAPQMDTCFKVRRGPELGMDQCHGT
uniref:Apple domain-containing protein n=1 Tax=Helicotheca tamesis TaxID=374047 RepID=A0A7S2N0K6_9STRA|mmetsp:Transcript_7282/g.9906  ORF Transcript_7282/g.9906 Transcript_7282/m.9906 type:complete len:156 (+) Transcript_7282:134-601(+)|eukprot:CAMPEP_0185723848 /NCGR_PEP_ID=MMETSP1171-20130828/547_1 /TAXON_ID=374046 /ORGANISM="Helicotheca tamensis, Strain CCMP826" /LENGTH=155 /DNA_ID=CAMNT_0028391603 /DNA_START=112 /DNA_END=579 /DNA_ORIENTATION=+